MVKNKPQTMEEMQIKSDTHHEKAMELRKPEYQSVELLGAVNMKQGIIIEQNKIIIDLLKKIVAKI